MNSERTGSSFFSLFYLIIRIFYIFRFCPKLWEICRGSTIVKKFTKPTEFNQWSPIKQTNHCTTYHISQFVPPIHSTFVFMCTFVLNILPTLVHLIVSHGLYFYSIQIIAHDFIFLNWFHRACVLMWAFVLNILPTHMYLVVSHGLYFSSTDALHPYEPL